MFADMLNNPDTLSDVVQVLGFDNEGEMFSSLLSSGAITSITELPRHVNTFLSEHRSKAAAAAAAAIDEYEVNGIAVFANGTSQHIIDAVMSLIDNKPKKSGKRSPSKTISAYTLDGTRHSCPSYSELVVRLVTEMQDCYPDVAVEKLCGVNGAIASDKAKLNPNGSIKEVGGVFVDTKKSAPQLETLALKIANAFGHELVVVS